MAIEAIIIILLIGAVAGWLAGQIVRGMGFGLLGNIVVGIVGAFIANWLLPQIGIVIGGGSSRPSLTPRSAPWCCWSSRPDQARLTARYAAKPDQPADLRGCRALCAKLAQAGGLRRLRQLPAFGIEDQPVVVIERRGQAEQRLQQRCTLVDQNRSCPRTTSVTPWSASSTTTAGGSWSACPCGRGRRRPRRRDRPRSRRSRRRDRRRSRSKCSGPAHRSPASCRGGWHRARRADPGLPLASLNCRAAPG